MLIAMAMPQLWPAVVQEISPLAFLRMKTASKVAIVVAVAVLPSISRLLRNPNQIKFKRSNSGLRPLSNNDRKMNRKMGWKS